MTFKGNFNDIPSQISHTCYCVYCQVIANDWWHLVGRGGEKEIFLIRNECEKRH